jgi:predicted nucleic acid-binding protein
MTNVCLSKLRRRPDQRDALLAAMRMPGLAPETFDVDHDEVLRLAVRTGLTTCDASYLWLANLGVPLITLDRQLAAAAETF